MTLRFNPLSLYALGVPCNTLPEDDLWTYVPNTHVPSTMSYKDQFYDSYVPGQYIRTYSQSSYVTYIKDDWSSNI